MKPQKFSRDAVTLLLLKSWRFYAGCHPKNGKGSRRFSLSAVAMYGWLPLTQLLAVIFKTRPCVVVSPIEMNAHLRTVIVVPMTTGSRPAGFRVPLTFQGKTGFMLLDQIRTLDKAR